FTISTFWREAHVPWPLPTIPITPGSGAHGPTQEKRVEIMASITKTLVKSPLHETAVNYVTDIWNDSCSVADLTYAIENGAVGATSNPVIVGTVLEREMATWGSRIDALVAANPAAGEDEIVWMV